MGFWANRRRGGPMLPWLALAPLLLAAAPADAQVEDPEFQDFFFSVCQGQPTGTLATRCAETPNADGDLSGDSEASLNPSQGVTANEGALYRARERQRTIREMLERRREEEAAPDTTIRESGRLSLLANGRYVGIDQDDSDNQRALDGDVWSAHLGGDFRLGNGLVVGALFAYEHAESSFEGEQLGVNFTPAGESGSIDSESYSVTVFGSFAPTGALEGFYIDGNIGYELSHYTFDRQSIFQETTRTLAQVPSNVRGTPDGDEFSLGANMGYELSLGALSLGPWVGLSYVRTRIDSYKERDLSGAGLNLRYDAQQRNSLLSTVGLRTSYALSFDWGVLIPQLRFAWEHEFSEARPRVESRYVLDPTPTRFVVRGDRPDPNYVQAGAAVSAVLPNGWIPFVDYESLIGYRNLERHTVTVGLRKEL